MANGVSALKGTGNRDGADYTISGEIKSRSTAVVSAEGVLLSMSSDSDSDLTVRVEVANITIPIGTKQHTNVERLP